MPCSWDDPSLILIILVAGLFPCASDALHEPTGLIVSTPALVRVKISSDLEDSTH